jgi:hypothetical protein
MIRDRKDATWAFVVLLAWLLACGSHRGDDAMGESQPNVWHLFGTREFDDESLPIMHWSKRTVSYFTPEKPSAGIGNKLLAKGQWVSVLPHPSRTRAVRNGRNTEEHPMETMTRFLDDNPQSSECPAPEPIYETRTLRGWTVHINRKLLADEARLTAKALELLDRQLDDITRVVPRAAVEKLQRVPLFFNPEYPGVRPIAEYHPDAGWLRTHGRDPAMAKAVEFTNVCIFEAEVNRTPWFVLHELAHAYHDRELPQGFRNPEIVAAYARAKESGKYDKVERHHGNGRPNTVEKAYAMTTPMEYFAETTEAYFGRNDFFPFTRDDLKKHDPDMFELLGKLWQVTTKTER